MGLARALRYSWAMHWDGMVAFLTKARESHTMGGQSVLLAGHGGKIIYMLDAVLIVVSPE